MVRIREMTASQTVVSSTNPPEVIMLRSRNPSGVDSRADWRRISPVEIEEIPVAEASKEL
jgi:hypothetical protein